MIVTREIEQAQSVLTDIGQSRPISMQERIFNSQREEIHLLSAENSQQRERIASQDEEIEALRAGRPDRDLLEEKDSIIAELRAQITDLASRYADLDSRHTDTTMRFAEFREWIITLFHNKSIPVACKIVLLFFHILFHGETGKERHITMKELADVTGYDEGTDRKACDKLALWDIIDRRYEDLILEDGTKHSKGIVYFTLDPIVSTPEYIKMENNHGGERERKCSNPDCRSTNLDNWTVRHCRDCKESAWYGQPRLRQDYDLIAAQNGHVVAQNRRNGNNQDASSLSNRVNTAIAVVDSQLEEIQTANVVGQLPGRTDQPEISTEKEQAYQQYDAARIIMENVSYYGYELEFLSDGKRNLKPNGNAAAIPTKAIVISLREQIVQYDPILREMYADANLGMQMIAQNCISGNNQDAFESDSSSDLQTFPNEQGQGDQLDAQRNTPSPVQQVAKGLGTRCEVCHYNEAVCIWKAGKCYCQACIERETLQ